MTHTTMKRDLLTHVKRLHDESGCACFPDVLTVTMKRYEREGLIEIHHAGQGLGARITAAGRAYLAKVV